MTAISYHDTVNDVQDPKCWGDVPFARREWFALLEAAGHKPLIAVAEADHGTACLPLEHGPNGLVSLTNWYAFTWTPGAADMAATGTFDALARVLGERTHRIDLTKLPDDPDWVGLLQGSFRKAGWFVLREECDTNHILPVNGRSFAEYIAARPGRVRTTLNRKARKVEVTLSTSFSSEDWAEYEDIYAESWKPDEGDATLLRRFAEAESGAGRYRFGIARAGGEAVAAQFWTVDGTAAYIHKLAHRESARPLSPGTTLTAALFEHVIDKDRVQLVDFGTGDDPYKRDWMEEVRIRWKLTCLRPESPRNWPAIAKAQLRKLVSRAPAG